MSAASTALSRTFSNCAMVCSSCCPKIFMPVERAAFAPRSGALPQVHGGVASPRSPRVRETPGLRRRDTAKAFADHDVLRRECIGPAQGAHGDVAGGPRADSGQLDQTRHARFRIAAR